MLKTFKLGGIHPPENKLSADKKIEELLGFDFDIETVNQLHEARKDRERGNKTAYVDLDSI